MANDWYRKTTWSETDQADFFARFKRSRTAYNKSQYLRIQACHLEGVGSPELLKASLALLDKMLAEFPDKTQLASAYGQKASCLAKLGEIDQAVANYQRALKTERELPNVKTNAFMQFGRLVVENNLTKLFDEAVEELKELDLRGIKFPSDIFQAFGIRSIITAHKGEIEKAKEFAKIALEAADKAHSGLRYHSTVGLVRDKETPFYKSIQAIALN
jgi:tetratricopeptide (TPR) repeat protein